MFNIFNGLKHDKELIMLNKMSSDIFYEKNENCITKKFFDRKLFDWEIYIITVLSQKDINITPEILSIDDNTNFSKIEYNMENLVSLRSILILNKNYNYIINELLVFMNYIYMNKIFIGNLTIDTIFVKGLNPIDKISFYIIDLSKASFTKECTDLNYHSLYLNFDENKLTNKYFSAEISRFIKNRLSKESYVTNIIDLYT